jgi:integrase
MEIKCLHDLSWSIENCATSVCSGLFPQPARLRRAVESCGLVYCKEAGTTSHGLRHLYAYTLKKLGLPRVILQEGLRHRNPFSSDRYGLPTPTDVDTSIKEALARSRDKLPDELRLTRTYAFMADRHPEYIGGAL